MYCCKGSDKGDQEITDTMHNLTLATPGILYNNRWQICIRSIDL